MPTTPRTTAFAFARIATAVAAAGALLTGCVATSVAPPTGTGSLRYRDPVFSSVTATTDLQYGSAPDLAGTAVPLKLDLYQPAGDKVAKRPAVVWVHGGGFVGGDKSTERPITDPLVKRGFVVVSINYRLLAPGGCSGSNLAASCLVAANNGINDGQAAVRWLRAKAATYRIDPNRIGIGGFSAGGIIATGVGVTADTPGRSGNPGYSSKVGGFVSVSGGLPGGQSVDATDAPGYLFSGTADPTVPYQWSVDTANALDRAHLLSVLYSERGVGHNLPDLNLLAAQSSNFYYRTLDLAHAQR